MTSGHNVSSEDRDIFDSSSDQTPALLESPSAHEHSLTGKQRTSGEGNQAWGLKPLTPMYVESEHKPYVDELHTAIKNDEIRNIALSGSYGTGKSSILREFSKGLEKGRAVEISLSTLAVRSSRENIKSEQSAKKLTNSIQKEIVKQLLYRERPGRTPASRFHRIERFNWGRELLVAALLGVVTTLLFLLTGWTETIFAGFGLSSGLSPWMHVAVWLGIVGLVVLFRRTFHGRFQIKYFSTGMASVTLSDESKSYFDQYLDEIVYFFEVSGTEILIFEDIDRFDSPAIFEELRALNTLLNSVARGNRRKSPIRFIYATKDSIFAKQSSGEESDKTREEQNEPASVLSLGGADRTKFFDIIIPVVPFITHDSALNHARELSATFDAKIDHGLLYLAAKYLPDMRLLINVYNEFIIFRERIFSSGENPLQLEESELFAMMLYKSTHLEDFESIRFGESRINALYSKSRQLVDENIKRLIAAHPDVHDRSKDGPSWAAEIIELLCSKVSDRQSSNQEVNGHEVNSFVLNGNSIHVDRYSTNGFWRDLLGRNVNKMSLSISTSSGWRDFSRHELIDELFRAGLLADQRSKRITEELEFLMEATLSELMSRRDLLVRKEPDRLGDSDASQTAVNLYDVASCTLQSAFAVRLVQDGYINENFTLYSSTYQSNSFSAAANTFLIHHVERNQTGLNYRLDPKDVDALVQELDPEQFREPGLYNIFVLDWLIEKYINIARMQIDSLTSVSVSQIEFLRVYPKAGKHPEKFAVEFARASERANNLADQEDSSDENTRLDLVESFHECLFEDTFPVHTAEETGREPDQSHGARRAEYLSSNAHRLAVFRSDGTTDGLANYYADFFSDAAATIPDISKLGRDMQDVFTSRRLFDLTKDNLQFILGTKNLALNVIRQRSVNVYHHVLDELETYLSLLDDDVVTIQGSEQAADVLQDLDMLDSDFLEEVVSGASDDFCVPDLEEVPDEILESLARGNHFPLTFHNLSIYLDEFTAPIDLDLAALLKESDQIIDLGDGAIDERTKYNLALKILNATSVLPEQEIRINLVSSLELEDKIQLTDLEFEDEPMFARMREASLIGDETQSHE